MRIFTVLLPVLCLIMGALSATTILGAEYTFLKPNEKNFVYENSPAAVKVKVNIASAAAGDPLAVKFFTADFAQSLDVSHTSACFDDANVEVFRYEKSLPSDQSLVAASTITAPKTCTFSATIKPTTRDVEYTKLGISDLSAYDISPTFRSVSAVFTASWAYSLVHTGETNVFTIQGGEIPFAKDDSFVITAPTGAPFADSGLTCDFEGLPLFSVSAQGSRMLFVARDTIATPFTCSVSVIAGPTSLQKFDRGFRFSAPNHGISDRIDGFVAALDHPGYNVRMGFLGPVTSTAPNGLYISIPAASVRAGSPVKLHIDTIKNVNLISCKYSNGALAGNIKMIVDKQDISTSQYSAVFTLASPLPVTAQNTVDLICDAVLTHDEEFDLRISAVSVNEGFFAASTFTFDESALNPLRLFENGVKTSVASYNEELNYFSLNVTRATNKYAFVSADLRLEGVTFADIADVHSKCQFTVGDSEAPQPWTPPAGLVTVTSGTAYFKITNEDFTDIQNAYIRCVFTATAGTTLAVTDNRIGKQIAQDVVHDGAISVIFGEQGQTHCMANDALSGGYLVPFTLTATKAYSQASLDSAVAVNIVLNSYDVAITSPSFVGKYDLLCTMSRVDSRSEMTYFSPSSSHNVFTIKNGYDAHCSSFAKITPLGGASLASSNSVAAYMHSRHGIHYAAFNKQQYDAIVKVPQIFTKEQFSFVASGDVVPGSVASFTVGHTLVKEGKTVTFTFHADATVDAITDCTVTAVPVLTCTVDQTSHVVTCTKATGASATPCTMSLTFAASSPRDITVDVTFSELDPGVIFHPSFRIATTSAGTTSVAVDPGMVGVGFTASITLLSAPRATDILRVSVNVDDAGKFEFIGLEPSVAGIETNVEIKDGFLHIPLNSLDETAATATNLKLKFRHISHPGFFDSNTFNLSVFDVDSGDQIGEDTLVPLSAATVWVGFVPTLDPMSPASHYNLVQLNHPGLAANDKIAMHGIVLPDQSTATLLCGAAAAVTASAEGVFTIAETILPEEPCYIHLPVMYQLNTEYWSFTATISGISTTLYFSTAFTDTPRVVSGASVRGETATITLNIPDITTALEVVNGSYEVSFKYSTQALSVDAISCAAVDGTVDTTVSPPVVTVTFDQDTKNLANYGNLQCSVTVTINANAELTAPKFTSVSVLGHTYDDFVLPPVQTAYVPSITASFPVGTVIQNIVYPVTITIDQMAIGVDDTITFTGPVVGDFVAVNSCEEPAYLSGNNITFSSERAASEPKLTIVCQIASQYKSIVPFDGKVVFTRSADGTFKEADVTVPAAVAVGPELFMQFAYVTDNMAVYRADLSSPNPTEIDVMHRFELLNADMWYDVSLKSNCTSYYSSRTSIEIIFPMTIAKTVEVCEIYVVFASDYIPELLATPIVITSSSGQISENVPAVKSTTEAKITANIVPETVSFTFSNVDSNILTIDNIWGLTESVKVYAYKEDPLVDVGLASVDGSRLKVTFKTGKLIEKNGKYSVYGCYFSLNGLAQQVTQSYYADATFTIGSASTVARSPNSIYALTFASADAILVPGGEYEVIVEFAVAGNKANVVLDFTNTALTAVARCHTASAMGLYDVPATHSVNGYTVSVAVTENNVVEDMNLVFGLKCVFNAASADAIAKKVGPYAKTIIASIRAGSTDLFSVPVAVNIPFFKPLGAISQVVSFQRANLFTSNELADLAKKYVDALRSRVSTLQSSQVGITRQTTVTLSPESVPSPIFTQFVSTANTYVEVTFATTTTTAAPVSTADVDAVIPTLSTAFATYNYDSAMNSKDTVVDGGCATRCGLGCSLCADGQACSINGDCIGGYCGAAGLCGVDSITPNSAAAFTTPMSVLALVAVVLVALVDL